MHMYVGIDIGGTKTLVAALTNRGVIQEQVRFPTPKNYDHFLLELQKSKEPELRSVSGGRRRVAPGAGDQSSGVRRLPDVQPGRQAAGLGVRAGVEAWRAELVYRRLAIIPRSNI